MQKKSTPTTAARARWRNPWQNAGALLLLSAPYPLLMTSAICFSPKGGITLPPYWLASAWAALFYLNCGWRSVPALLGVGTLTSLLLSEHGPASCGMAALASLTGSAVGLLLKRSEGKRGDIKAQGHTLAITGISFSVSLLSSLFNVALLTLLRIHPAQDFLADWLFWWLGTAIVLLHALPLYFYVYLPFRHRAHEGRAWPSALRLAPAVLCTGASLLSLAGALAFRGGSCLFLLFLPLFLCICFGSVALLYVTSSWLTLATGLAAHFAYGPFSEVQSIARLIDIQLILCSLSFSALMLHGISSRSISRQVGATILCGWLLSGLLFYVFHEAMPHQGSVAGASEGMEGPTSLAWIATLCALLTMSVAEQLSSTGHARVIAEALVAESTELLRRRERLLNTLMECAPVGIFYSDQQGAAIYSNRKWREMKGLSEDAPEGGANAVIHEEDRERVLTSWNATISSGGTFEGEYRLVRVDGRTIWLQTYAASILDAPSQTHGYVGVAFDITQRREEARLLEEERMRSIHAARMANLGEMAANIAHEINNPLAIINAITCEISMSEEHLSEGIRTRLDRIETTTLRIAKIVRGLRQFSRDSGEDPFEAIALPSLLGDVVELCRERFRIHKVALKLATVPDCHVLSRGVQLSQVFINLLSNAFDAVQGSDEAWVEIETEWEGAQLRVLIRDSGPGIRPEIAQRIMEPFFTTKEIGKGTGLGLSIAQGIMQDHGGELALLEAARHTTFVVTMKAVAG